MVCFRDTAGKTPIYKGVMEGKNAMVETMLSLVSQTDKVEDLCAKDGTTAFSIALGALNASKYIKFIKVVSLNNNLSYENRLCGSYA